MAFTIGGDAEVAPELSLDDVRLESGAIPEPATTALLVGGLAAAALARRRKRAPVKGAFPPV